MTKELLKQELLKKIKPGIKPSDLKKLREKNSLGNNSLSTKIPIPPILPPKPSKKEVLPSPIVQLEPEATIRPKSPILTTNQSTPETKPQQYLFTCDICEQNKKSQLHLGRVNGLGIDPHKTQKICDYCIKRVDLIQPKKEDFF
jgi:hypothetical protein